MALRPAIFSSRSVTISALPIAVADLYCNVKLPSFGPTVGAHLVTADRKNRRIVCYAVQLVPLQGTMEIERSHISTYQRQGQSVWYPVWSCHTNCHVWSLIQHLQCEGGIHLSTCFSHNLFFRPSHFNVRNTIEHESIG